MFEIIYWLGTKNKNTFIRFLANTEYGVSIFCKKLSKKAAIENHHDLSRLLLEHSKQEESHGKMLSCILDGTAKYELRETGFWESISFADGEFLINHQDKTLHDSIEVNWQSLKRPGFMAGRFQRLDGISARYFSTKYFFNNKEAFDHDWVDVLAMMCVLEKYTQRLYEYISRKESSSNALGAIAAKIAKEESTHSDYLFKALSSFTSTPDYYLDKWNDKIFIASLLAVVDLMVILLKLRH